MCVRTKTSYGCGHVYRSENDCCEKNCRGLEKYHIIKERDCRTCRKEIEADTRGRHGFGRYGQEPRHTRARSPSCSIERASPSSSYDDIVRPSTAGTSPPETNISPWVDAAPSEKAWETPHRKQADDAWLSEHEDRISDLQERLNDIRLNEMSASRGSQTSTPTRRHRHDAEESHHNNERDDGRFENPDPLPKHAMELSRRIEDRSCHYSSSGRSYRQETGQHSNDSLPDSMPSYHSSPRHKMPGNMQHTRAEGGRDYDYYTYSRPVPPASVRHSSSRPKTETYRYASSTSGYDHERDHGRTPPMYIDSRYSSPRYYQSSDFRYKTAEPNSVPYVRYHPRY